MFHLKKENIKNWNILRLLYILFHFLNKIEWLWVAMGGFMVQLTVRRLKLILESLKDAFWNFLGRWLLDCTLF